MNWESFARKLQDVIKNSGIQQNIIAEALDLSSAAISQFIHGTALPNPEQLNSILVLLCIPDEEQIPLMQELHALREEAGEEEIKEYYADDEDEDEDDDHNFESVYTWLKKDKSSPSPFWMVAEPEVDGIPLIHLHDLDAYTPGMGLQDFATLRPHDLLMRDYGSCGSPIAIQTTGSQLGLRYCGILQLVIAEDVPVGLSAMALLCLPNFKYRIIPTDDRNTYRGLESLFDAKLKIETEPLWVLPVIEFSLLPIGDILNFGER